MSSKPVTLEMLARFAPELAEDLRRDAQFLGAAQLYFMEEATDDDATYLYEAWAADRARFGGAVISRDKFFTDLEEAKESIEGTAYSTSDYLNHFEG